MRHKQFILALAVALFVVTLSRADDFSDALHDLAIQTACLGQYSATQAGGGWYDDPHDYYTPQMMAERFANMSGSMTRTSTFYGVCFDYAEAAYNDIDAYQSWYNEMGMYEDQFFIAGVDSDSSVITLSWPTTAGNATVVQNGVYVQEVGKWNIMTHKMTSGARATHHAWLLVERYDGVWFWIDPTWTDNLGYIVWGCIRNGEEVQLRPDERFCVNYPSYLNSLPTAPAPGRRKSPSSSGYTASAGGYGSDRSSNGRSSGGRSSGGGASRGGGSSSSGYGYSGVSSPSSIVIGAGFALPLSDKIGGGNFGISFSVEDGNRNAPRFISIYQFDYYRYSASDNGDGNGEYGSKGAVLFDYALGWQFAQAFALYGGAGLGFSGESLSSFDDIGFAWKVNGGIRVMIRKLYMRTEVQYVGGMGVALGAFVGWGF